MAERLRHRRRGQRDGEGRAALRRARAPRRTSATSRAAEVVRLPPLFADQAEDWTSSTPAMPASACPAATLPATAARAFLGIDAGSTTFKAALIGQDGELLWTHYVVEQGRRARLRESRHRQALPRAAARRRRQPAGDHRPLHGHGLRRAPAARGTARGLGRDRDGRAPARRAGDAAGRRVHPGHRRPGHEVPARERRRHRPHHAQRGVLLGLRQLHRELRQRPEPGRVASSRRPPSARKTPSTWAAAAPYS